MLPVLRAWAGNVIAAWEPNETLGNGISPYLQRWYVQRDKEVGNMFVHVIHRSDAEDELHDHPFDNVTIVLDGEIEEILPEGGRMLQPGDIVVRKAADLHRLVIGQPVTTLFVTGPKIREWGFDMDGAWMHNREFFKLRGYA